MATETKIRRPVPIDCTCANPQCGKAFQAIPSRIAKGRGKYCSRACHFNKTEQQRFWEKVNKNGPIHPVLGTRCWLWTGCTDQNGYGWISRRKVKVAAHVFSWEIEHGPLPSGKRRHDNCVLHHCDVRNCVNHEHLFHGSQEDNMRDCSEKGRINRPSGIRNPAATLTPEQVKTIREIYGKRGRGGLPLQAIGLKFNLSVSQVFRIVNHQSWKEVS